MIDFKAGDRVKVVGERHSFLGEQLTGEIFRIMNNGKSAIVEIDDKFLYEGEPFSELILLSELVRVD